VTVKIIILSYLVNWSKELREGDGKKCLQMEWNSSVSSDVFWILLLGRVISWFAPHGCLGRCQR
jgi:hypothetical protein